MRRSNKWLLVLLCVLCALSAAADNGEVAYAFPVSKITVDGDSAEWPESATRYPITRGPNAPAEDLTAFFRVGYSEELRSIFIALEVQDDEHVAAEDPSAHWSEEDCHILYLDPTHQRAGSGAWLFHGGSRGVDALKHDAPWDPVMNLHRPEQTEFAVKRDGTQTTYEWRVDLGERFRPGVTLGFDFLLRDIDADGRGGFWSWGRYNGKSQRSARIGDLVLAKPGQLGELQGEIAWKPGIDGPDLANYRVTIQSLTTPGFWVQPNSDENRRYSLQLPPGRYRISSPFPMYGEDFEFRLRDDIAVEVTVEAGAVAEVPTLHYDVVPPPALRIQKGLLRQPGVLQTPVLEGFVQDYMHHYQIPGVSIAVIKDGRLAYEREFGVLNGLTQQRVTPKSRFEAGSVTKIMFAFAVNRLVERGEIDLDQPLYTYLPFEEIAHDERYKKITARHVLTHQTGFPNWARFNEDGKLDIKFEPGTQFGYSGEGFEYLGRVVAHLQQKELATILREEVLVPMGLSDFTVFKDDGELKTNLALGHDMYRPNVPYLPSEVGVAHSMHTNAAELAKLMLSLMQRKGLKDANYDKMFEPAVYAYETGGIDWPTHFSLGFQIRESPFGNLVGHGGSNHSNECLFEYDPATKSGFVVMTNSDAGTKFYQALRRLVWVGETSEAKERANNDLPSD